MSNNTTREAFLSRIREALGRPSTAPTPLARERSEIVRLVHAGGNLPQMYAERAKSVGMSVHPTILSQLPHALRAVPFARAAISIEDSQIRELVQSHVPTPAAWRDVAGLEGLYDADVGITDVFAAIAETGTLVIRSSALTSRGGFLVPPIHVAILRASQIIPDMVDLWPLLRSIPTSVVLITGPSKTADIEGILITGVHGPKEVHILLIEDA